MLVFGERGKPSHSRVENQQTQPTYDTECGNRTRATSVEGKCSHHCSNPATDELLFSVSCHPLRLKFTGVLIYFVRSRIVQ